MKHRRSSFSDKRGNRNGSDSEVRELGRGFSSMSDRKKGKPDPRQNLKLIHENDLYERQYA